MYHQWFNSREYGEKEEALIEAIKALGMKPIKYGEQPHYEEKITHLKECFREYIEFCEAGHHKLERENNSQK